MCVQTNKRKNVGTVPQNADNEDFGQYWQGGTVSSAKTLLQAATVHTIEFSTGYLKKHIVQLWRLCRSHILRTASGFWIAALRCPLFKVYLQKMLQAKNNEENWKV
jgi:hypothetical protein